MLLPSVRELRKLAGRSFWRKRGCARGSSRMPGVVSIEGPTIRRASPRGNITSSGCVMSHRRRIQRPTRRANVRCPAVIFAGWVTGFGRSATVVDRKWW